MTEPTITAAAHARINQWFDDESQRAGSVACAVCESACGTAGSLRFKDELHHLTDCAGGSTVEQGQHEDLVAVHAPCHDWIHMYLDQDDALRSMTDRRQASRIAITRLRARLDQLLAELNDLAGPEQETIG